MGTRACPDVEDSGAALAECDRLPLLERLLFAKKKRWVDFFRRSEIVSNRHRNVLSAIVERRQSRPEGRPRTAHTKWGWLLGRHTFPVIFQGFLSK